MAFLTAKAVAMQTKPTCVGYSPRRRAWFAQQRLQPLGVCAVS
ncbi:MAG: hypothetical protein NZ874_03035 [Fimbriimonadales bacterium]|nr:hypothetical protein [Fimbriimonadales bacterium]